MEGTGGYIEAGVIYLHSSAMNKLLAPLHLSNFSWKSGKQFGSPIAWTAQLEEGYPELIGEASDSDSQTYGISVPSFARIDLVK
jgi:hypothetical protein